MFNMGMQSIARSSFRLPLAVNSIARGVVPGHSTSQSAFLGKCFPPNERHFSLFRNIPASRTADQLSGTVVFDSFRFRITGISNISERQFPSAALLADDSDVDVGNEDLPGLGPTKAGEKPRVVVLGTGWAGCRFLKGIDAKIYDVVCISPRNHMVFTPLLASTCVGTLEFRSVAEPVSWIQPTLATAPNSYFYLACCIGINTDKHEANEILSSFDVSLRQYASNHLTKSGVRLMRGVVKEVLQDKIILSDGTNVPYGLLVWCTGVGPSQFVKALDLPKAPGGRIGIDEWLRVPSVEDVFALGDAAGFLEHTGKQVLPALAQVAEREGKYLAELLSKIGKQNGGKAGCAGYSLGEAFVYKHLGSMASVGRYKEALVDLRQSKDAKGLSLAEFISWFIWRSAYLTRVVSWRNRFYVAVNWATTFVFGRDNLRIG